MAFLIKNFAPGAAQASSGMAPVIHTYKSDDTHATIDSANYFDTIRNLLRIGDLIYVVVVTNLGLSTEALSTAGFHVVKDKSTTHVDVTDVTVLTMTDTD